MSVSHPLLKKLKNSLFDLCSTPCFAVLDDHPSLTLLCQNLEDIFRLGLKSPGLSLFGRIGRDYWHVAKHVATLPVCGALVREAVGASAASQRVGTAQGRGRLFLRLCLVKHCLADYLATLSQSTLNRQFYSSSGSIVGREILCELFRSLLLQIDAIKFRLNWRNGAFFDVSWLLPVYRQYDLPPCLQLAMTFAYSSPYIVVVGVDPQSPAAEDDRVEVGDILDQIYGHCLHGVGVSRLTAIADSNSRSPLQIAVLKCHSLTGDLFPPAIPILTRLKLNLAHLSALYRSRCAPTEPCAVLPPGGETENDSATCTDGVPVCYLGVSFVGSRGNVSVIDVGISNVLDQIPSPKPVQFVSADWGVSVLERCSGELLFHHSYTQIASCGRHISVPVRFAYVAGEVSCSESRHFYCHVFSASDDQLVNSILHSIAQGFRRTQFAV